MVTKDKRERPPRSKPSEINNIAAALDYSSKTLTSKPLTTQQFAQRLSAALAQKVADALRPDFKGVLPDRNGGKHESLARTSKSVKRLDVNYSTTRLGLALGVSIKTTNAPEGANSNYAKNVTGRDYELRAEAEDYHERQPYAVLVALYFLPIESCDNATPRAPSSFGKIAMKMRFRSGRKGPKDLSTLFEAAFIGLYEPAIPNRGAIEFFDASCDPPRSGRPANTLTFEQVIQRIKAIYDERNVTFRFADSSIPVTTAELDEPEDEAEGAGESEASARHAPK